MNVSTQFLATLTREGDRFFSYRFTTHQLKSVNNERNLTIWLLVWTSIDFTLKERVREII